MGKSFNSLIALIEGTDAHPFSALPSLKSDLLKVTFIWIKVGHFNALSRDCVYNDFREMLLLPRRVHDLRKSEITAWRDGVKGVCSKKKRLKSKDFLVLHLYFSRENSHRTDLSRIVPSYYSCNLKGISRLNCLCTFSSF